MAPTTELHPRERQIMDVVYLRGEATVSEVLDGLADPPSYSTVRAMLGRLEGKGFLTHRQDGVRYVYQPAHPREVAQDSALSRLMRTFFDGSPAKAMAAILDQSEAPLSEAELDELAELVESARRKGR